MRGKFLNAVIIDVLAKLGGLFGIFHSVFCMLENILTKNEFAAAVTKKIFFISKYSR